MPDPIASPESGGRHTPGPWFAHPIHIRDNLKASKPLFTDGLWHIRPEADPETCPIAEIDRGDDHDAPTRAQAEANARLIAAAPCMAEALRLLARVRPMNWQDDPDDAAAWSALDAALARASAFL